MTMCAPLAECSHAEDVANWERIRELEAENRSLREQIKIHIESLEAINLRLRSQIKTLNEIIEARKAQEATG